MYTNASNELNQMIENVNNSSLKARIVFADGSTIDKFDKLVFYGGSNKSDAIQIGSTTMAYFEASIETDRLLTNEEVTLECGAKLSDGTEEYIPIGKFTFQKPVGDIDGVEVVANDRMQRFERVYSSSLTYPTTSAEVLNELCTICGVTLATPIENPIEITDKLDGYTCREVLGFISALHGKFACIDRFGELNVRWYSDSPITKETRVIWSFTKAEHNTTIDKVEIHKNTEVSYTSGSGFNVLFNSNPYATQESTDNVFNGINGFTYNASKIELVDDIRLDCWDVINVPYLDGNEYLVPCMALTQDFSNGSTIIQAFSKSEVENEYNYNGAISNYIERVAYELLLANRVIATKVDAEYVTSHAITTENFEAKIAEITHLVVQEIDGKYATIDFANIDIANINKANIGLLFAEVGLIDRATIVDGHITGFLDAVEINANKITAGTLMVDRLVFRGSEESIIYELNNITSKNLIAYPYAESTHTESSIIWTDNGDGTITANGTSSNYSSFFLTSPNDTTLYDKLEHGETYSVSGVLEESNKYYIYANFYKDGTKVLTQQLDKGKGGSFVMDKESYDNVMIAIQIIPNATLSNVIFKPMLCKGTEVLPYEPYRERTQALTSETVNGEVLTDRTITADKIIAKSITSNEIDVAQLFADEAAIRTLVAQSIFTDAIETNRVVVGKANRDEIIADNLLIYPYQETSHLDNDIQWTDLGDGTVKANGTASAISYFNCRTRTETGSPLKLSAGTYTMNGCPSGGSNSTYFIQVGRTVNGSYGGIGNDYGNGVTFTLTEETQIQIMCVVNKGATVSNLVFKPMLELGSVAHPYREYKKGGTGIANNLYYQSTTLIDGNKIYTGTVTADKIDVDDLFAENINMTGKFISTGKAQLAPGIEEFKTVKAYRLNEITLTDAQKVLYDFNKDGTVNITDMMIAQEFALGRRTIESLNTEFGYTIPQSDIQTVINSSNPQKVISISATNSWGRQVEAYFGLDGLSVPKVEANSIRAFGIEVEDEIDAIGDVYANYGLDTEVSLLGLKEKVDYLQPRAYSLARTAEMGVLTTTQTTYNTYSGRKFSDYGLLLITIGASTSDVRASLEIPSTVFTSGNGIDPMTVWIDCWSNSGNTFNHVAVKYVSDTSFIAYLGTSSTVAKYLNIYGIKVDASSSGRSVDAL